MPAAAAGVMPLSNHSLFLSFPWPQEERNVLEALAAVMKKTMARGKGVKHLALDTQLRRAFDRLPLPEGAKA